MYKIKTKIESEAEDYPSLLRRGRYYVQERRTRPSLRGEGSYESRTLVGGEVCILFVKLDEKMKNPMTTW